MGKRICMVAYTNYATDARPRRAAEALAGRGDEVHFLALSDEDGPRTMVRSGVRLTRLPVKRYRGSSGRAYIASYLRFFATALRHIAVSHARKRYDVVYTHSMPDSLVFVALPARVTGAKIVLDLHDTMPEVYETKFGIRADHLMIRTLLLQERLSGRFADRVVCVHEPHRDLLASRSVPAKKISVVLNLPDPAVFGAPLEHGVSPTEGPPLVVFHGRVTEAVGLDLALRAFRTVVDEVPQARFSIYGEGDFADGVRALIADLALGDSVDFPNKQFPVAQLPALLKSATVGIVPNRADATSHYMLPAKLLEYVYLGIPVVAPRLPTISHYFGADDLAFFQPDDVDDFARALRDVLTDSARWDRLRSSAWRFYEHYSWDAMRHNLFAAIDE